LLEIHYNTLTQGGQFNPVVTLNVQQDKQPTMQCLTQIPKESLIYRVVMQNPSREAFLSDYGKFITGENLKNNFSMIQIFFKKEDFHLRNLNKETIQKNMQIKNCLEFKCLVSFDKLLQKGYAHEDFSLLPNTLDASLLAISKISFFELEEADNRHILKKSVAKGEPISYSNELQAYLKYNEFILRTDKIVKNSIKFLQEFSQMKETNKGLVYIKNNNSLIKLSEDYEIGFNYAILGYEKLLVKISHLELVAEHLKSLFKKSLIDLKKQYLFK